MAEDDLSLKDFVATYPLPHVAKVTQGYCSDNNTDEHDFSTNDVLMVSIYRVGQKKLRQIFLAITLVNMDRF